MLERGWESLPSSDEERGIAARYEDSDGAEGSEEEAYLRGASDDEDERDREEYFATLSDDGDEDAYLDEQPSGPCQSIIAADWE